MTLALLCSGQGLQSPTMFALTADAPQAARLFDRAGDILGCDPRKLVARGEEAGLFENLPSQILCVTQALAAYACIADILPPRLLFAGYSVGEMAAWSLAGTWTPDQILPLVRARAELMDRASRPGDCLCAVRGLDRADIERLSRAHGCEIAIVNPDQLFVIGGGRPDIDRLCEEALGAGATRASVLAVNVASHTSRMTAAIAPFQQAIDAVPAGNLERGRILLSGSDGSRIRDPAAESGKLARQIGTPLDWAACLDAMVEANVDRVLELGPGRALANMARSLSTLDAVRAFDDFKTIDGIRRWIMND
jgi:[acyl-carrier-protein] S-malonyltransferase